MNEILNFVYCFDENYIKQAETSIISLLDSVDEKINILIIYTKQELDFSDKILNHRHLNNLQVYEFKDNSLNFPNIEVGHVSIATYFRFFISDYFQDFKYLIYLDTDIVAINNPIPALKETISKFKTSKFTICAVEEHPYSDDVDEFKRLSIKSSYFNAGVLIIDFEHWNQNKIGKELIKHMETIRTSIKFWDQDVMNSYFDGKYVKISKNLNYSTSTNIFFKEKYKEIMDDVIFLHFSGKIKPWSIKGTDSKVSEFYHRNYRKISSNSYHLVPRNKKLDISNLISIIIYFKFAKLDKKIKFLKEALYTIFK